MSDELLDAYLPFVRKKSVLHLLVTQITFEILVATIQFNINLLHEK